MRHAASFALMLALAASGWAQTWDETADGGGNADDLPATAQTTFGVDTLMEITGTLASNADVDMFRIFVADFAFFSADTSASPGTVTDTELYLFTDAGIGIAFNDDIGGGSFRSRLPVGNALYATREPGNYLLAVCSFDRDPVNASGQIFPNTPFTSILGPTGAGNQSAVTTWTGAGSETGTYRITLTGVEFAPVTDLEGGAEGGGEGGSQGGALSVTRAQNPAGGGGGCYAATDTLVIRAALALLLAVAVAGLLRR